MFCWNKNSVSPAKGDQRLRIKLEKWRDINKNDMVLVHCIRLHHLSALNSMDLFKFKAEDVFRKWDVISLSLIRNSVLYKKSVFKKDTGMASIIGLVLDVPPQNILGTHCRDVMFPNHIGTGQENDSWKLADAVFSGIGKPNHKIGIKKSKKVWPSSQGNPYNIIESPFDILSKSDPTHYNEILVIGKPDVSLYHGYPPTKEIKVKAIVFDGDNHRGWNGFDSAYIIKALNKLYNLNPGIKYICSDYPLNNK